MGGAFLPTGQSPSQLLEVVFDVLGGLVHLCFGLVGGAFGRELVVVGGVADLLLGVTGGILRGVLDLVVQSHFGFPSLVMVHRERGANVVISRRRSR